MSFSASIQFRNTRLLSVKPDGELHIETIQHSLVRKLKISIALDLVK